MDPPYIDRTGIVVYRGTEFVLEQVENYKEVSRETCGFIKGEGGNTD